MIRIIMADYHPVVCAGIKQILDGTGVFMLADQVPNGEELLRKLALNRDDYDLVVLEISMPGKEAFDIIREIRSNHPELPVVIFTFNREEHYALRFFRLGASAFIRKDSQPEQIIQTLKIVAGGRTYYTPTQVELMADFVRGTTGIQAMGFDELTDRELQVLYLLANGLLKGEIASKLEVSKHTISNHRNNILKKLNLRNNSELTRYAIRNRLIS